MRPLPYTGQGRCSLEAYLFWGWLGFDYFERECVLVAEIVSDRTVLLLAVDGLGFWGVGCGVRVERRWRFGGLGVKVRFFRRFRLREGG